MIPHLHYPRTRLAPATLHQRPKEKKTRYKSRRLNELLIPVRCPQPPADNDIRTETQRQSLVLATRPCDMLCASSMVRLRVWFCYALHVVVDTGSSEARQIWHVRVSDSAPFLSGVSHGWSSKAERLCDGTIRHAARPAADLEVSPRRLTWRHAEGLVLGVRQVLPVY